MTIIKDNRTPEPAASHSEADTSAREMSDTQLGDAWLAQDAALEIVRGYRAAIEAEIGRRMQERQATEIPHPTVLMTMRRETFFDRDALAPLRELVPPDALGKGYTPAHAETVQVAEKWNMQQVKVWAKYGGEIAAIIERASKVMNTGLMVKVKKKVTTVMDKESA